MSRMDTALPQPPAMPEITPLQGRAIRRFEHDGQFFKRVHAEAAHRRELTPDLDLATSLQASMADFQASDEESHSDDAIVRGAYYVGNELLGIPYALASVPQQEGLKAAVRRVLEAVEDPA